ncbi:hypothetical protein VTO73DRAFT_726 [Trametes versicolor]
MSSQQSPFLISVFHSPFQFPPALWECFKAEPRNSNIIYAHAAKLRSTGIVTAPGPPVDVWIVCWRQGPAPIIEFVLSCTTGPLGAYPVFIYTPLPSEYLALGFIQPRIHSIIGYLQSYVAPERVFSVFALDPVADAFAAMWTAMTRVPLATQPVYYHAQFMSCDRTTFKPGAQNGTARTPGPLRLAVPDDHIGVAALCHGFAASSEPFVLTEQMALYEASLLINSNTVWVHTIQGPGQVTPDIACIVSVTRTTETVAAITKVYTNPNYRSRGCAERLVRFACASLLRTKQSVVLYVAHNNQAAKKVYERVGFVGFAASGVGATDSWKELGFDQTLVRLGHW